MTTEQPAGRTVVVRLNQQQLELVDRTASDHGDTGREDALKRALMGFHALVASEGYES